MSEKRAERGIIIDQRAVFDLILLAFFLMLVLVSFRYNLRARSIPLFLGAVGFVMVGLQFLADAVPALRQRLWFLAKSGVLSADIRPTASREAAERDTAATETPSKDADAVAESSEMIRILRVLGWLVLFIVLLGLIHYLIAVGVFLVLAVRLEARESWTKAIILALGVDVSFYVLFDLLLGAHL